MMCDKVPFRAYFFSRTLGFKNKEGGGAFYVIFFIENGAKFPLF